MSLHDSSGVLTRLSRVLVVKAVLPAILLLSASLGHAAQREQIELAPGQSTTYRLMGDKYGQMNAIRITQGRGEARGISATLGSSDRRGRTITIRASRDAQDGDYRLEGQFGRGDFQALPVSLVIKSQQRQSTTPRRGGQGTSGNNTDRPTRDSNTRQDDDRNSRTRQGDSRNRDSRSEREEMQQRDRRSSNDRRTPDRREQDQAQERTPRTLTQIEISPKGSRAIQLGDTRYRSLSDVRVVSSGRVSQTVNATLERSRQGLALQLSANENASLAQYTVQGRINGRWVELPFQVSVTEVPRDVRRRGDLVEYRHRETVTLPDGTRVVVSGETQSTEDDEPFVPTPVVSDWLPKKFGELGGSVTIEGTNFSEDLVVKIGDVTLETTQLSATQITASLPESSSDCPPGALQVRRDSGSLIHSCEPHFFVMGDEAFHHFENTSSHSYINSYLTARLSRIVYNDYFGVSTWSSFKSEFEEKVRALGATDVEFVKAASSPGDTELAIIATPAVVVVVFRGSESPVTEEKGFEDWFNTNADIDKLYKNTWAQGAWVHEGFYNAYNDVHSTVRSKILSVRNNGQPVFITGHSLGGALATMAAYRLNDAGIPIKGVYTFGSPRVGNSEWVKAYDDANLHQRTQRWVNRQDFGPRFPPFGEWRHVGRTNNIHQNGSVKLNDTEVSVVAFPNEGDHNMDRYCSEILQELSFSQKNKIEDAAQ